MSVFIQVTTAFGENPSLPQIVTTGSTIGVASPNGSSGTELRVADPISSFAREEDKTSKKRSLTAGSLEPEANKRTRRASGEDLGIDLSYKLHGHHLTQLISAAKEITKVQCGVADEFAFLPTLMAKTSFSSINIKNMGMSPCLVMITGVQILNNKLYLTKLLVEKAYLLQTVQETGNWKGKAEYRYLMTPLDITRLQHFYAFLMFTEFVQEFFPLYLKF